MFGLLLGGELLRECITVFNKEQVYRYGGTLNKFKVISEWVLYVVKQVQVLVINC